MCLLLRTILGRENAKDRNAITMLLAALKVAAINRRAKDEHMNPDRIRILKLHKRWADGLTLLW